MFFNVLFWRSFPCPCQLLSPFWWWWPPLASVLPLLHLVAVVLVLDMWSVVGVAPVVSSQRLGVACEPISNYACFLISAFLPTSQPTWAAESDRSEGSTDVHLELTGLISKEVIWGNHLFQGCYPSSRYFLELPLESVVPASDSLNDMEAALRSFSAESRE